MLRNNYHNVIVMFFSTRIWDVSLWKSDQQNLSAPTRHYRLQDLLDRSPSMLALLQSVIEHQQQLDMDMPHIYDPFFTVSIWLGYDPYDQPRLGVASGLHDSNCTGCGKVREHFDPKIDVTVRFQRHRTWAKSNVTVADRPNKSALSAQKWGSEMFGALEDVQSGKQNLEGKLELFCLQGYR